MDLRKGPPGAKKIEILERPESYPHLFRLGERMRRGVEQIVQQEGIEATAVGYGSVYVLYFLRPPIQSYRDLLRNDSQRFLSYRRQLIELGSYELPINLKRNYISLAHTQADIDQTLESAQRILRRSQTFP